MQLILVSSIQYFSYSNEDHSFLLLMEFVSVLTKISLYNYTVSILRSVIGLRQDISDYNAEQRGKEPQHENVKVTMKYG